MIPNIDYCHQVNLIVKALTGSKVFEVLRVVIGKNVVHIKGSNVRMECFQKIQECAGEERSPLYNNANTRSECDKFVSFFG